MLHEVLAPARCAVGPSLRTRTAKTIEVWHHSRHVCGLTRSHLNRDRLFSMDCSLYRLLIYTPIFACRASQGKSFSQQYAWPIPCLACECLTKQCFKLTILAYHGLPTWFILIRTPTETNLGETGSSRVPRIWIWRLFSLLCRMQEEDNNLCNYFEPLAFGAMQRCGPR